MSWEWANQQQLCFFGEPSLCCLCCSSHCIISQRHTHKKKKSIASRPNMTYFNQIQILKNKKEKFKNTDLRFDLPIAILSHAVWCAGQMSRARFRPIATNYQCWLLVLSSLVKAALKHRYCRTCMTFLVVFFVMTVHLFLRTTMHQHNEPNTAN